MAALFPCQTHKYSAKASEFQVLNYPVHFDAYFISIITKLVKFLEIGELEPSIHHHYNSGLIC